MYLKSGSTFLYHQSRFVPFAAHLGHSVDNVIGSIYRGYRKDYYDENVLELLSRVLRDIPKSKLCKRTSLASKAHVLGLSLDALQRGLRLRWEESYDVIIPYGDIRHTRFETV